MSDSSRKSAARDRRDLFCLWMMATFLSGLFSGCFGGDEYVPPEGVTVEGVVLKGGEPLKVRNRNSGLGRIEIKLIPLGADGVEPETTLANADGSFLFQGPGRGIPPGKYRLTVFLRDDGPESDGFEGAFNVENSPIDINVSPENLGGTFDLGTIELDDYNLSI